MYSYREHMFNRGVDLSQCTMCTDDPDRTLSEEKKEKFTSMIKHKYYLLLFKYSEMKRGTAIVKDELTVGS